MLVNHSRTRRHSLSTIVEKECLHVQPKTGRPHWFNISASVCDPRFCHGKQDQVTNSLIRKLRIKTSAFVFFKESQASRVCSIIITSKSNLPRPFNKIVNKWFLMQRNIPCKEGFKSTTNTQKKTHRQLNPANTKNSKVESSESCKKGKVNQDLSSDDVNLSRNGP